MDIDTFLQNSKYKLSFNLYLDAENNPTIVRYFQIGIQDENGFTGLIADYVGGGTYQDDFIYLHNKMLSDYDNKALIEIQDRIDEAEVHYNGLFDEIYQLQDLLMKYSRKDEWFIPTPEINDAKSNLQNPHELITNNSNLSPISVANTLFYKE